MRYFALIILVLLVLPASSANAQFSNLEYRFYGGVEVNEMRALRNWQSGVASTGLGLGIPLQQVESFPPYLSVRAEVAQPVGDAGQLGISVGYSSTGGRLYYSDRSGFAIFDQVVVRHHIGLFTEVPVPGPLPFFGTLTLRYNFTTVNADARIAVGESSASSSSRLNERGIGLEPTLAAEVFSGRVRGRLLAGIELARGNDLNAGWRGVRLGGMIVL